MKEIKWKPVCQGIGGRFGFYDFRPYKVAIQEDAQVRKVGNGLYWLLMVLLIVGFKIAAVKDEKVSV